MSGMTPERLDAILDGRAEPNDDQAREMLALAGALREAAPDAPEALRARVRTLSAQQPLPSRLRRLRDSGWRGRILVAAPALSAVIAVLVAVGVIGNSGGPAGDAGGSQSARVSAVESATDPSAPSGTVTQLAPAADAQTGLQPPAVVRVAPATLAARLTDVRRLVADAGGTLVEATPPPGSTGVLVSMTLPPERRDAVLQQILALGTNDPQAPPTPNAREGFRATSPVTETLEVLLTESPG